MKVYVASSNRRCHSNAIEASAALRYLAANGAEVLAAPEGADLALVLTCGSLGSTRERTAELVSETARRAGGAPVYAAGCLTGIARGELDRLAKEGLNVRVLAGLEELDAVIGASRPFRDFTERYFDGELYSYLAEDASPSYGLLMRLLARLAALPAPARFRQKMECAAHTGKFHVMIGRGCAGNCAYCVIKKARGRPVSRPAADILADIARARRPGQTLNLVADDCGSWGADAGGSLPQLLDAIREAFPGLKVDLRYVNPAWLEKDGPSYFRALSAGNINSVNLCIQSGSDRVLGLMGRAYHISTVLDFAARLRQAAPGVLLRTHVIAGFPGETQADFLLTLRAAARFDMLNCYPWSPPPGSRLSPADFARGRLRKAAFDLLNFLKLFW